MTSASTGISTRGKVIAAGVVGAFVLAVCGVLFWLWGMNVIHWFTADFREFSAFWILVPRWCCECYRSAAFLH